MAQWERRSTAELRPGGTKADRSKLTREERIRRAEAMGGHTTIVPKTKRASTSRLVTRGLVDRSLEAAVARANRSADVGAVHQALLDAARRRAR